MRVLQVHNAYRSDVPSGENDVVDREAHELTSAGVTVSRYLRQSDEIDGLQGWQRLLLPVRPLWSPEDLSRIQRLLAVERIDVVHLHNPNPLISMGVVRVARRQGVPVVMTVHNHRHTCISGSFSRDGAPCHDCRTALGPLPGVVHGCYRGSRPQSAAMASALVAHRGSWQAVTRFLTPSGCIRDSLLRSGPVDPGRVFVKPNSVVDPGPPADPPTGPLRLCFVGRLDVDKGLRLLLDAWARGSHPDAVLTVVGSGPMDSEVRAQAALRDDIEVLGQLDAVGVASAIRRSHAVVVPSLVEEAFGLVALEAQAHARAVITTGLGGLGDLVDDSNGWRIPPDARAWARILGTLDRHTVGRRGAAGRAGYLARYTPERVTEQLLSHYEEVVSSA